MVKDIRALFLEGEKGENDVEIDVTYLWDSKQGTVEMEGVMQKSKEFDRGCIGSNRLPPKVRGDLSKWLFEINTGVYVGNISARVRELCGTEFVKTYGKAGYDGIFGCRRTAYGVLCSYTSWQITDFDGIKLMKRPLPIVRQQESNNIYCESGFSKAAKYQKGKKIQLSNKRRFLAWEIILL